MISNEKLWFKSSISFFSLQQLRNTKMVVGENQNGKADDGGGTQQQQQTPPQPMSGLKQATIDNIMSGIENTGAVKMNNHRKKLRQR